MAPEDSEITNETPVIVGDVDAAPEEVTVEGDTTIIVDAAPADDAPAETVTAVDLDHAQRITALELAVEDLRGTVAMASFTADEALERTDELAAEDAAIVAATDEAIVETIEGAEITDEDNDGEEEIVVDEIAPVSTRKHILFRSFAELRGK